MTKQEYYDLLVAIERPAWDTDRRICMYRGPCDSRCAVGVLIPDADYSKELEGRGLSDLTQVLVDQIKPDGMRREDLSRIQRGHDTVVKMVMYNTRPARPDLFRSRFIEFLNDDSSFQDVRKTPVPEEAKE